MTRATRTSKAGPDIRAAFDLIQRAFDADRDPSVSMDDLADMLPGIDAAMNKIIAARGGPALGRAKLRIVLRRLEGMLGPDLDEEDDDLRIVRLLASAIADIEGQPYVPIPARTRQVAS